MLSLSLMLRGTFHITLSCLCWSSQAIVVEPRTLPPVAGIGLLPLPLPPDFFQKKPIIAKIAPSCSLLHQHALDRFHPHRPLLLEVRYSRVHPVKGRSYRRRAGGVVLEVRRGGRSQQRERRAHEVVVVVIEL